MLARPVGDVSLVPFQETTFNLPTTLVSPVLLTRSPEFAWDKANEEYRVETSAQSLLQSTSIPPDQNGSNVEPYDSALRCSRPECRHQTFKRNYEYRRHLQKHSIKAQLPCPVQYCRRHTRPFNRDDKLSDHMKLMHTQDELASCPIEGCSVTDMPLILLGLHCRSHFNGFVWFKVLSKNLVCCLKKCKMVVPRNDIAEYQRHLLSHDMASRRNQQDTIRRMGFEYDSARVICPICKSSFETQLDFIIHLEAAHLTTNYQHWRAVMDIFESKGISTKLGKIHWVYTYFLPKNVNCPYCGATASNHHLRLLEMSDEIRNHRGAILLLIPDFIDHPIFDGDLQRRSRLA
jgi:uncharacterized C2H2 Zn-finger protein